MERRRLSRRSLMRACRYRIENREIQARLVDISWDGACIGDTGEVPEEGTRVSLLLGSGASAIEITGHVTHVGLASFGVKFEETRGNVMRKLRGFT